MTIASSIAPPVAKSPDIVPRVAPADGNFLIKGDNLEVLEALKPAYAGKVDLIYIDPPYNRDSKADTMCYANSFERDEWLGFMEARLEAARPLMKPEGVLIVAIDGNEFCYLGVLLDRLFPGHEVHCITIVHNPRGVQGANFSYTHEYAFFVIPRGRRSIGPRAIAPDEVEWNNLRNWGGESLRSDAKNCFYPVIVDDHGNIIGFGEILCDDAHPPQVERRDGLRFVYPIDRGGVERKWRYARQSVDRVRHLLRVREAGDRVEIEIGKDFGMHRTVWTGTRYDSNRYGSQLLKALLPDARFDFPKSLWTVVDCLQAVVGANKEALVLDFFAGSGTTAHALMELNRSDGGSRRFILVERMDYIDSVTAPRIAKAAEQLGADGFQRLDLDALATGGAR